MWSIGKKENNPEKYMRREKITWLVVLLLMIGSVLLVWTVASRPQWSKLERPKADLSSRLASDYARDVKIVIDNYLSERMNYGQSQSAEFLKNWRELAAKTQSAFLKLKVPAKKTELHLNLVLELNNIQDALLADDLEKARAAEISLIKLFGRI